MVSDSKTTVDIVPATPFPISRPGWDRHVNSAGGDMHYGSIRTYIPYRCGRQSSTAVIARTSMALTLHFSWQITDIHVCLPSSDKMAIGPRRRANACR